MKTRFKAPRGRRPSARHAWVAPRLLGVLGLSLVLTMLSHAAAPSWWAARGINNGQAAADYAIANQGQLKNMARAAREEMVARSYFSLTDSNAINTMVNTWSTNTDGAQDYAPVNLGQLKFVAKPFYDVLKSQNPSVSYPWTSILTDDLDYGMANIGQLKNIFQFAIPEMDMDHDGIPDQWEIEHGLNPNNQGDASLPLNNYGLTPLQAYLRWLAGERFSAANSLVWDWPGGELDDEDGDGVPNYKDANPIDFDIKELTITINAPGSGPL